MSLVATLLGIYSIRAMYNENDMDPVIAFGYLSGLGLIVLELVFSIHSVIMQRSKRKPTYKCAYCSYQL